MTGNVLPCPFCGSPAEVMHDTSSDNRKHWSWAVHCQDPRWLTEQSAGQNYCAIHGPDRDTADAAIAAWNERRAA